MKFKCKCRYFVLTKIHCVILSIRRQRKNPENLFIAIKFQGIMYNGLGQIKMTHYFSSKCIINNILNYTKLPANKNSYAKISTQNSNKYPTKLALN